MKKEEVLGRLAAICASITSTQDSIEELLDDQETLHHGEHAMLSTAYKTCGSAHTYVERVLHNVERPDVRIPDDALELTRTDHTTMHVWVDDDTPDEYYHLCERSYDTNDVLAATSIRTMRKEDAISPYATAVTLCEARQLDGSLRYGMTVNCDNCYANWDNEDGWRFSSTTEAMTDYDIREAANCIRHVAPLIPRFVETVNIEEVVADFTSHFRKQ